MLTDIATRFYLAALDTENPIAKRIFEQIGFACDWLAGNVCEQLPDDDLLIEFA